MMDSCSPRKLEPGFEQTYSMPSVLMTSTMKSEPVRSAVRTSAGEGVPASAAGDIAGGCLEPRSRAGGFAGHGGGSAQGSAPPGDVRRKIRGGKAVVLWFFMRQAPHVR